jgi:hypothetical protein
VREFDAAGKQVANIADDQPLIKQKTPHHSLCIEPVSPQSTIRFLRESAMPFSYHRDAVFYQRDRWVAASRPDYAASGSAPASGQ